MRNHSYKNNFDLHENETARRTHFHMKRFTLKLVLKLRHKRTRKWPIQIMWWFIWEAIIVLFVHNLMHSVVCDKLHNCNLPNESSYDLNGVATTMEIRRPNTSIFYWSTTVSCNLAHLKDVFSINKPKKKENKTVTTTLFLSFKHLNIWFSFIATFP